jgi:hypothetical protein
VVRAKGLENHLISEPALYKSLTPEDASEVLPQFRVSGARRAPRVFQGQPRPGEVRTTSERQLTYP